MHPSPHFHFFRKRSSNAKNQPSAQNPMSFAHNFRQELTIYFFLIQPPRPNFARAKNPHASLSLYAVHGFRGAEFSNGRPRHRRDWSNVFFPPPYALRAVDLITLPVQENDPQPSPRHHIQQAHPPTPMISPLAKKAAPPRTAHASTSTGTVMSVEYPMRICPP